jgi:hypothetical protein
MCAHSYQHSSVAFEALWRNPPIGPQRAITCSRIPLRDLKPQLQSHNAGAAPEHNSNPQYSDSPMLKMITLPSSHFASPGLEAYTTTLWSPP